MGGRPLRKIGRAGTAVLLFLLAGCAAGPAPAPADRAAAGASEARVLAILPAVSRVRWALEARELAVRHGLEVAFAWEMTSLGQLCVVLDLPGGGDAAAVARRLAGDPRVDFAQPVHRFRVLAGAWDDPYAELQPGLVELEVEALHRRATGRGVRVAIVDTGVDVDHPDLRGRVARIGDFADRGGSSFTEDVHGTAIAGVIAANANNATGIVGIAPRAELVVLKACWQEAPGARGAVCDSYTLARALDVALAERVRVINLSLTGPRDPLLGRLVARALEAGVVVVAAVDEGAAGGGFPASLPGVVAVRARAADQMVAAGGEAGRQLSAQSAGRQFSAQSAGRHLSAPGKDILSTAPRGAYDFFSGSSFAAAHVTGVVALLLEADPELGPERLGALLHRTARRADAAGPPRLDPCAALSGLAGEPPCATAAAAAGRPDR